VDSGATCHMSNIKELFTELKPMLQMKEVTLGDRHKVEATAVSSVSLKTLLPSRETKQICLNDALYVLQLSCRLKDFDYNTTHDVDFCKACIGGKQHRSQFESSGD